MSLARTKSKPKLTNGHSRKSQGQRKKKKWSVLAKRESNSLSQRAAPWPLSSLFCGILGLRARKKTPPRLVRACLSRRRLLPRRIGVYTPLTILFNHPASTSDNTELPNHSSGPSRVYLFIFLVSLQLPGLPSFLCPPFTLPPHLALRICVATSPVPSLRFIAIIYLEPRES